jgi:hypothetical protein
MITTTHILLHASAKKHASYRSKFYCERIGLGGDIEDCDEGPLLSLELTTDEEYNNVGECYNHPNYLIDNLGTHGFDCYIGEWVWDDFDDSGNEIKFCGGLGTTDECRTANRKKWFWYPECGPQ